MCEVISAIHDFLDEFGGFVFLPLVYPYLGPDLNRRNFACGAATKLILQLAGYAIIFEDVLYVMHYKSIVVTKDTDFFHAVFAATRLVRYGL